jgi:manganese-transporting P-type ATPase
VVRDTALLLLLLLIFALAASGYVLKKGMEDGNKSKYQLLLHCVLIITSVIPPELPMQMALAVNSALITLMRMQIFCTEPFRVPIAGKIDVCLFDKTGTLTTDELVAVGVTDLKKGTGAGGGGGSEAAALGLCGMPEAPVDATVVLGVCHALVLVEGKVAGDPIEAAALKAIKWEVVERRGLTECRPQPQHLAARGAFPVGGLAGASAFEIDARHHFSSKLQRMSVVAHPTGGGLGAATTHLVLVKGSPEALAPLLRAPVAKYHNAAASLAKEGMRVLALAYKVVKGEEAARCMESRVEAEAGLEFAGFVAFTCRVRKDTGDVIKQLLEGQHKIAMVTGDALLTAVHVAKQVGICSASKTVLLLHAGPSEEGTGTGGGGAGAPHEQVWWKDYHSEDMFEVFDPKRVPVLAQTHDLCTTGKALAMASELFPAVRRELEHFVVFARMTPDEKEAVITSLKDCGRMCLMCGDGANDVGALKQANVGVALLSGFGDLNVDRGDKKEEEKAQDKDASAPTAIMTKDQMAELQRLKPSEIKKKLRLLGVEPSDHPQVIERADLIKLYQAAVQRKAAEAHDKKNARDLVKAKAVPGAVVGKGKKTPQEMRAEMERERREMYARKQVELQKEMEERRAKGESWVEVKALWAVYSREMEEVKKKREKMAKESTLTASAAKMAAMMDEMEEGEALPMVKIGDASVAAPFTSKMPSIRGTVDIIRQGRCTLVTTIQMYQILALTCLISSYSLSVLHLDGVKYGDYQMTALGILMSVSFVTVSRSKPLDKLSGVRPFTSIFHPALFASILGQFALHLGCMMGAVQQSKRHLPPDYKPDVDGEFKPGIINSVVFLVSAVQQVSEATLYQGLGVGLGLVRSSV